MSDVCEDEMPNIEVSLMKVESNKSSKYIQNNITSLKQLTTSTVYIIYSTDIYYTNAFESYDVTFFIVLEI